MDVLYAALGQFLVPEDLDLQPNSILRGCDDATVAAVNAATGAVRNAGATGAVAGNANSINITQPVTNFRTQLSFRAATSAA
ncbi:hypothetical protein HaLaN_19651 [Haematococcus lacustris]|uniref:Uncharacterized protein n=1 Tax=Haematococcus lacustris TaxID=44745 RepID=A0A6A0A0H4_HAELA|nr:hypothetical protein HaLaN_19651 [Haematococcus lacustris]